MKSRGSDQTNETSSVSFEEIDEENQNLLSQTGALHKDRAYFKERSAQLEAQLNQAVASERFLKQQLGGLEERIILKDAKIQELEELGNKTTKDYSLRPANWSKFSEILGREQVLLNRTSILENENLVLSEELSRPRSSSSNSTAGLIT